MTPDTSPCRCIPSPATASKPCIECGRPFHRPPGQRPSIWARRKLCGALACNRAARGHRVWSREQKIEAVKLKATGLSWVEVWQQMTGGLYSTHRALRESVGGAHDRGELAELELKRRKLRRVGNECRVDNGELPAMTHDQAAAWLSRPPPRLLQQLRCEPEQVVRRLATW